MLFTAQLGGNKGLPRYPQTLPRCFAKSLNLFIVLSSRMPQREPQDLAYKQTDRREGRPPEGWRVDIPPYTGVIPFRDQFFAKDRK